MKKIRKFLLSTSVLVIVLFVIQTQAQVSDLEFSWGYVGSTSTTGPHYKAEKMPWNFYTKNIGDSNATIVDYKIVLSEDEIFDTTDTVLREGIIANDWTGQEGLEAGKSISNSNINEDEYIEIPCHIEANKTYYYIFWIEQDVDGGETNIANNVWVKEIYIGLKDVVSVSAADDTPLGDKRPLLLVHGWQTDGRPAEPNITIWNNFVYYFNQNDELNSVFKIYYVRYYSNVVCIDDIGHALRLDLDNISEFDGKQISILAHSMGGLVSRSFMNRSIDTGVYAGQKGGNRVEKLITLGTPHHGSPMANGDSRETALPVESVGLLTEWDGILSGIPSDVLSRKDMHWDNHRVPNLFDLNSYPEETNEWLISNKMNLDIEYDSKIITYSGSFFALDLPIPEFINWHFYPPYMNTKTFLGYKFGNPIMKLMWIHQYGENHPNDGIVPKSSAQYYDHDNIQERRHFSWYNHHRIAYGVSNYEAVVAGDRPVDNTLFGTIKMDLLDFSDTPILLSTSSEIIEFPEVLMNTSFQKTFILSNTGTANLTIVSASITGDNLAEFSLISPLPPFDVILNEEVEIVVQFNPTSLGDKSATLVLNNNSVNAPTKEIDLTGTSVDESTNLISLLPESAYDFGEVYTGGESQYYFFKILNQSSSDIILENIELTGVDSNLFSILNLPDLPITMPSGSTGNIYVSFSPTSIGEKIANLVITNDSSNAPNHTIVLSGTGVNYYNGEDANKIISYEYWFDNDYTNHVINAISPSIIATVDTSINTGSLNEGLHILHIRFKDKQGQWSSVSSEFFTKHTLSNSDENMIEYEYWFDNDYANRASLNIAPNQILSLNEYVDATSLDIGLHTVHFRFKDNNGQWSSVLSEFLTRERLGDLGDNVITSYRHWFNSEDTNIPMLAAEPSSPIYVLEDSIDTSTLVTDTANTIHIQFRDIYGQWSSVLSEEFYICGNITSPIITVDGNSLISTSATTYQWFLDGVLIEGATSQTYEATEDGNYTVAITDVNGCEAVSDEVNIVLLGLEEVQENFGISLIPNPSKGVINVINLNDVKAKIIIYNSLGQEVYRSKSLPTSIDLSLNAKGIYLAKISSDNRVFTKKIILK